MVRGWIDILSALNPIGQCWKILVITMGFAHIPSGISTFVTRRVSSQIKVISIGKNYNGFFWQVQNQVVQRSSFNHYHSSRLFFFRNLLKFINGKRNTCYKASLMLVSVGLGNFNFRGRKIIYILTQMSTPFVLDMLLHPWKWQNLDFQGQFTVSKIIRHFWN